MYEANVLDDITPEILNQTNIRPACTLPKRVIAVLPAEDLKELEQFEVELHSMQGGAGRIEEVPAPVCYWCLAEHGQKYPVGAQLVDCPRHRTPQEQASALGVETGPQLAKARGFLARMFGAGI